jgi:DNA-directed RNA polymerase subunit M/transcription elongation factor TFIIS
MSTKLHFCPKCETLLSYVVKKEDQEIAKLACSNCPYQAKLEPGQTLRTSIYGNTRSAKITKAAVYDPSLRLTSTIVCPNTECDSNNPAKLGELNEEGRRIQPEVCITNHTSVSRINSYICRICRTVFKSND